MNEQLDLFLPLEEVFKMAHRYFIYGWLFGTAVTFGVCLLAGLFLT